MPNYIWVPYHYSVASAAMAGNASNQQPLVLDQDADFELHEITATSTVDNATDFRPNNFSVQITDKNNSRIWSNNRIPQVTYNPCWILTRPVLIAKRSNLNFDFLNLSGSTNTATIVLLGFKVYMVAGGQPMMPQGGAPGM